MILKYPTILMAIYMIYPFTNAKILKYDLVFDKKFNIVF